MIVYINNDEPETDYGASSEALSAVEAVLENANFLRDTYANDKAAARALDIALKRHHNAKPLERARLLAARAELAVAMGEQAKGFRDELTQIGLSEDDQERYRDELNAADDLARWIGVARE